MPPTTRARAAASAQAALVTLLVTVHPAAVAMVPWSIAAAAAPVPDAIAGVSVRGSTATWMAEATGQGAAPATSELVLEWTSSAGVASAYLDVVNSGSLELVSQRLLVSSRTDSGSSGPDPVELAACVGAAWAPSTGTCAGTVLALGSDRASPLATDVLLAPGARLSLRATTRPRTAAQTTTTVTVLVTRADARPSTMTAG